MCIACAVQGDVKSIENNSIRSVVERDRDQSPIKDSSEVLRLRKMASSATADIFETSEEIKIPGYFARATSYVKSLFNYLTPPKPYLKPALALK